MALKIVHHEGYQARLKPGHRFPMGKYQALARELSDLELGTLETFYRPVPAPAEWIMLAHDRTYVDQVFCATVPPEVSKKIGFDVSDSVARRARLAASGTVLTARLALEYGIAANSAGGSHHANSSNGAGFCVFNDVAIAAKLLVTDGEVEKVMIVDCDVHQGDGTARIFTNDPSVFTVSLHGKNNYPSPKTKSDLDYELEDNTGDLEYLGVLENALVTAWSIFQPDIVFYNAGVDPHEDDALGRLSLSDKGLANRDHRVMEFFRSRNIPIACVIGGGYGKDIAALAMRHSIVFKTASQFVD